MSDTNMSDPKRTNKPEWKKTMKESNVIGWIAFLILVLGIGVGTMMFGGEPVDLKSVKQTTSTTGLKYLQ